MKSAIFIDPDFEKAIRISSIFLIFHTNLFLFGVYANKHRFFDGFVCSYYWCLGYFNKSPPNIYAGFWVDMLKGIHDYSFSTWLAKINNFYSFYARNSSFYCSKNHFDGSQMRSIRRKKLELNWQILRYMA